jgi:hypothetical protein
MITEYCNNFWGSHGCSLPPGHAYSDRFHQCGLDSDEDGICSKVVKVTGTDEWFCQYMMLDGWDAEWYPTHIFNNEVK